jgi:hypothetical protein
MRGFTLLNAIVISIFMKSRYPIITDTLHHHTENTTCGYSEERLSSGTVLSSIHLTFPGEEYV